MRQVALASPNFYRGLRSSPQRKQLPTLPPSTSPASSAKRRRPLNQLLRQLCRSALLGFPSAKAKKSALVACLPSPWRAEQQNAFRRAVETDVQIGAQNWIYDFVSA